MKKIPILIGAFTTKSFVYSYIRYQDNGRATAKAPLNMMRYLRPNKRYKSFSDAPFTLRIATSRERCLMSNNEIPNKPRQTITIAMQAKRA